MKYITIAALALLAACGTGNSPSKTITGIDLDQSIMLKVTPGMSGEQVISAMGQPVAQQMDPSNTYDWWRYGADSNQVVVLENNLVIQVNPDMRGTLEQMDQMLQDHQRMMDSMMKAMQ